MFGTVLIAFGTLMHAYVTWRVAVSPPVKGNISRKWILAAAAVLWVLFYLGRAYGHHGTGLAAEILELAGMTWMGVLLLCTIALSVVDLATGFGFFFSRRAPVARGVALFAGLALSAFALVQGNVSPVPERFEIELAGLPPDLSGTVLVAVSDVHVGRPSDEERLKRVVEVVQAEKPDLVVFLGDIFEGHGGVGKNVVSILESMRPPLGKWAVPGNHESHGDDGMFLEILRKAGFRVLIDEWAQAAPGLLLAGTDDLRDGGNRKRNLARIFRALSGRPKGATIFLSHRPVYVETLAEKGADLVLGGHTHAGQIWPFSHLVSRRYPFISGRYDTAGTTVVVSRGAGTWGPRMRLWRPGDILSLNLRSGT